MRLITSEQHAELIKIYSSPHLTQSPLVINSRTVTKITKAVPSQVNPSNPFPLLSQFNLDSAVSEETDLDKTVVFIDDDHTTRNKQEEVMSL